MGAGFKISWLVEAMAGAGVLLAVRGGTLRIEKLPETIAASLLDPVVVGRYSGRVWCWVGLSIKAVSLRVRGLVRLFRCLLKVYKIKV